VARAATTTDAFNAVAEPRRRQILDILAGGERPVNELVTLLGLSQPLVSKHLRVLREVGLADVREAGRQRMYRINTQPLESIHDWVKSYEQSWSTSFDRLDVVVQELKEQELQAQELQAQELQAQEHREQENGDDRSDQ
jgi:DNA-binding transcriptional ArsR family regulator